MNSPEYSAKSTSVEALQANVNRVREWLFNCALPLWRANGVEPGKGFTEALDFDGRPEHLGYKRIRVQARQIYVFSHSCLLGNDEDAAVAENGWRFICRHGKLDEGGWVRRLDELGEVLDPTLDLYDQATVLFALAWWARVAEKHRAMQAANRTLDAVERRLGAPCGFGWVSDAGESPSHLQNPHMHLLEALLALHETFGGCRFLKLAESVLTLFLDHLYDAETGTLAEYFDASWRPASGEIGRTVEPGHHYEWVWLLHRASKELSVDACIANNLFDFARSAGSDNRDELIVDEVLNDGTIKSPTHRLWPHAEAVKAHVAMYEWNGSLDATHLCATIDNIFEHFLTVPVSGTWFDRIDANNRPISAFVPASSMYHLMFAFSELLRIAPQLNAQLTQAK